jgi:hypothetical protein
MLCAVIQKETLSRALFRTPVRRPTLSMRARRQAGRSFGSVIATVWLFRIVVQGRRAAR